MMAHYHFHHYTHSSFFFCGKFSLSFTTVSPVFSRRYSSGEHSDLKSHSDAAIHLSIGAAFSSKVLKFGFLFLSLCSVSVWKQILPWPHCVTSPAHRHRTVVLVCLSALCVFLQQSPESRRSDRDITDTVTPEETLQAHCGLVACRYFRLW